MRDERWMFLTFPHRPPTGDPEEPTYQKESAKVMKCNDCGSEVSGDLQFCPGCGKQMTPPVCPKCKAEIGVSFKFCGHCGFRIESRQKSIVESRPFVPDLLPEPGAGLTIEFPFSSAQSYDYAIRAATNHPGYISYCEGKKIGPPALCVGR
jgi:hypothetical protein